jgi:alkylation response protein AidB-like acyl-CoA dehydrogenase
MDFDYSAEQRELRDQARQFLAENWPCSRMRTLLEQPEVATGREFCSRVAELGWMGATIPEALGGAGLGHVELCALAEELGRALVPGPLSSTLFGFTEALRVAGDDAERARWFPRIAAGEIHGSLAFHEGAGDPDATACTAEVRDGRLYGVKWPVTDGVFADVAVVLALEQGNPSMQLVELDATVQRLPLPSLDDSRPVCRLAFDGIPARRLGDPGQGRALVAGIMQRLAVLCAFEQLGGADRCLEMARDHALQRRAFGRPIGSFQAIKHRLADMYVRNELARSNAYLAAWALAQDAPELGVAAAAARLAASDAYEFAARENLQVHGGIAITWEADPHLYLRRARQLGAVAGSMGYWAERLTGELVDADRAAREAKHGFQG